MTDYDLSNIKAFAFDVDGVLSPSTIPMDEHGTPLRMANIKDGYALQLAVRLGYKIAIITGGTTEAVNARYQTLGLTNIFQGAANKLPVLENWLKTNDILPEETVYMGDDIPDIPCLKAVGLSCAPADAAIDVKDIARYISPYLGGQGCVRDILEQVMRAQGHWLNKEKAFGW